MAAISQTDFLACIFLNEDQWFPINISQKVVPKGPIKMFQHWLTYWLSADQDKAIIWANDG